MSARIFREVWKEEAEKAETMQKGEWDMTENKEIKHYNGAIVMGIVSKVTEEKTKEKKPYLELLVDCPNPVHGNVRVLGRVWGKFVEQFKASFKQGSMARLQGTIQQYDDKNGNRRASFNFFQFSPGPLKEMKAVFILTGKVEKYQDDTLTVKVVQNDGNGKITSEEDIEVYVPGEVLLTTGEPESGQTVKVKGYLVQKENEFGEAEGVMRAEVKEMEL